LATIISSRNPENSFSTIGENHAQRTPSSIGLRRQFFNDWRASVKILPLAFAALPRSGAAKIEISRS
jgi:hypothetical protein